MKTSVFYIILVCIVCFCSSARAQEVVASSGNHFSNNEIQISWTLGEPVIQTLSNNNVLLTQGFHQAKLTVTAIEELDDLLMQISAYPNPTSNFLKLSVKNSGEEELYYSLYTLDGKMLMQKQIESDLSEISMMNYISAIYFLKVTNGNSTLKTFKIIKQ